MTTRWLGLFTGLAVFAGSALAQAPTPSAWVPGLSPYSELPYSAAQAHLAESEALAPMPNAAPDADEVWAFDTKGAGVWFDSEYLLWKLKAGHTAQFPLFGALPASAIGAGVLPAGSIVEFPGDPSRFNYGAQSGFRLTAGCFLDGPREWSVSVGFFQLEHQNASAHFASTGNPAIGPVFNDTFSGLQTLLLFSVPDERIGVLDSTQNNRLWGTDINLRRQVAAIFWGDRLDFLIGIRQLQFGEGLDLSGTHTAVPGFVDPVAQVVTYHDHFGVQNDFLGGQIGFASHADVGDAFTVDLTLKLALGDMREVVKNSGSTTLVEPAGAPGTIVTRPGGVLVQPTNIGRSVNGDFGVIPEITLNVGWRIAPGVTATVGYNFLYINSLFRVAGQVDNVDARQIVGSAGFAANPAATSPAFQSQGSTTFWVQGLNAGLEFTW